MVKLTLKNPPEHLLKLKEALEEGKKETSAPTNKKSQSSSSQSSEHQTVPSPNNLQTRRIPWGKNERILQALNWLFETFPLVFKKQDRVPLKLSIEYDIFVWLDEQKKSLQEGVESVFPTHTAIRDAISFYTHHTHYQKALLMHDSRYDLNGAIAGIVDEKQKACARERYTKIETMIKNKQEKRKASQLKTKQNLNEKQKTAEKEHETKET